jgi:phosphosulfolactate synthase
MLLSDFRLRFPERMAKPRRHGLTMVLDGGMPTRLFQDVIESTCDLVDLVKFGWGTALVTKDLGLKRDALTRAGVDFCFGGTLFEKFVSQGRFDDFRRLLSEQGARCVEVSNGSIELSNERKCGYVETLARDFRVISEVGFKDSTRSLELPPMRWVEYMRADLEAGAEMVIAEARESGRSGICRADGEIRYGLIEEIIESGLDMRRIMFEAPTRDLQTYFIRRLGPNVNLGNIAPEAGIGLETLRLGLRADTLQAWDRD